MVIQQLKVSYWSKYYTKTYFLANFLFLLLKYSNKMYNVIILINYKKLYFMKKLLVGLFVFSFLLVGFQIHAAMAQENLSITLESNPQASNGTVTINLGDTITFTGFPNNLTGDITTDYTRSFNFDPIFDGVCNQNDSNGWSQKCTPTQTGTGTFSIQITQNGQTYNSNVIKVNVVYVNPEAPSITVLTPNGRDMYEVGQQINVTWNSTGISANSNNIDITLHGYNANGVIVWSKELSSFTFNDGQEKVILPTNLGGVPFGKNFVISVGTDSTNNPSPVYDFSDTTFTIGPATDVTNGGCSNGEVYSSTSGQACPKILDANDGCYGARYSATTGKACPLSMVTEEGCTNGAIYSYTTGAKCSRINIPICPANMPNPLALCSDGRIEAATKDSNNCTTSYRCTNPINDLGCKNHETYSTITKQVCPLISLDNGCTSTSKYSSTTGQACLGKVPEVDGGCNGINKYSLMTGKLCSNFTGVYTPVFPNTIDIPINRTLKLGIKGDDVKALQAFLNLLADGSFGPKTQAKVMEWQAAHGLTADGSFGSMSRQKAGLSQ
jgi:hypothetical protein